MTTGRQQSRETAQRGSARRLEKGRSLRNRTLTPIPRSVLGECLLLKKEQPAWTEHANWCEEFQLD